MSDMFPLPVQLLMSNAQNYSKGLLSEILEFVMGNGMIPGEAIFCTSSWQKPLCRGSKAARSLVLSWVALASYPCRVHAK